MKKLLMIAATVAAVVFATACIYQIATHENILRQAEYDAGFDDGIQWAIENMEVYTCERYNPDDPEATARADGYEQTIYIDLGGLTYEHGAWVY